MGFEVCFSACLAEGLDIDNVANAWEPFFNDIIKGILRDYIIVRVG